ncbi:hypothetical protein LG3211_2884 [Lysobacter gummosus]|nr:hypothetical protein LG3211_2884 [Lysobacter gummosus]
MQHRRSPQGDASATSANAGLLARLDEPACGQPSHCPCKSRDRVALSCKRCAGGYRRGGLSSR